MIISFAWTSKAFLEGTKTMTRRKWRDDYAQRFKLDTVHKAYDKDPRWGGKCIGHILITGLYKQWLHDMPEADLAREGGLWKSKDEFIKLFGGDQLVWVIEFKKGNATCPQVSLFPAFTLESWK